MASLSSIEQVERELHALLENYLKEEQTILEQLPKQERISVGHPIKNISQLDEFTANGNKYIIRTSLTVNRFQEFEKIQIRVGYGVDFRTMFTNIRKAYDNLNNSLPADAAIVLYNIMNGIKNELDGRENEVLDLCALFICREGEDLSVYDDKLNKAKIDDWKAEGISMESFFTLAFNLVNSFIPVFNQVSASISDHLEKVQNEVKSAKPQKSM